MWKASGHFFFSHKLTPRIVYLLTCGSTWSEFHNFVLICFYFNLGKWANRLGSREFLIITSGHEMRRLFLLRFSRLRGDKNGVNAGNILLSLPCHEKFFFQKVVLETFQKNTDFLGTTIMHVGWSSLISQRFITVK